jgi:hypothetical protein
MLASDVRVQSAVRSLDQGRLGGFVKAAMFAVLIAALSLLYLFVQFNGLATPDAMDQAQIARRLADGKGFTTGYIRPLALSVIQRQREKSQVDVSRFPDFFLSPLHPWVNSFGLRPAADAGAFLLSLATLATLFAMEARYEALGRMIARLVGAAACFGLATLAHGLAVWIFLGWFVFVCLYFPSRGVAAAAALATYLVVVTPWLVRNFQISGNPFGVAIYGAFFNSPPEEFLVSR